ncbi:integrase [Porphyromonas levii]|nr:integrase [Porphyromonas levii]
MYHTARHTFATLCLTKGVPMESVSKMLGHTNIKTTQIYGRITNKKIEKDMMELADKIGDFSLNNVPPLEAATR